MKRFFLPLLVILMLVSCNNDDDAPNPDVMTFSLVRDHHSPLEGLSTFYEPNQVLWTFDFTNQTITIETQQGIESPILPIGNYNYLLIDTEDGCQYGDNVTLVVNGDSLGGFILDELAAGKLLLTEECYDGNGLYFEN